MRPLSRSLRMLIGGLMLLIWIAIYIILAVLVAALIGVAGWPSLLYYVVAGVAWALPLKPFLAWMSRPDAPAA